MQQQIVSGTQSQNSFFHILQRSRNQMILHTRSVHTCIKHVINYEHVGILHVMFHMLVVTSPLPPKRLFVQAFLYIFQCLNWDFQSWLRIWLVTMQGKVQISFCDILYKYDLYTYKFTLGHL